MGSILDQDDNGKNNYFFFFLKSFAISLPKPTRKATAIIMAIIIRAITKIGILPLYQNPSSFSWAGNKMKNLLDGIFTLSGLQGTRHFCSPN